MTVRIRKRHVVTCRRYPIAQFLPIMDEIAGLFIRHNFGTFIFQDLNNAQLCTAIVLAFVLL